MTITSKTCARCGKSVPLYTKVGDTCPHCGIPFAFETGSGRSARSGVDFRRLVRFLIYGVLVAGLFMPVIFMRSLTSFTNDTRLHLQGLPAERLQAGQSLVGKSRRVLSSVTPDYLQAIRTSDTDTRVALIRLLVDINRAAPANSPQPFLPPQLILGLRAETGDGNPAVHAAVEETLKALGAQ
jgi:hypothetical protein